MMASENLALVQRIGAAWERGDYSSTEWADPQIEWVVVDGPTPGSWSGLAGMSEGWRAFLTAWDDFRGTVEEYRELHDERVLALHSYSGRGKISGLDIGQTPLKAATVFHLREGKVTRLLVYFDRDRALADLGLGPNRGSP